MIFWSIRRILPSILHRIINDTWKSYKKCKNFSIFYQNYQMLLKHLVKVPSVFNALKGYPKACENYAQKSHTQQQNFSRWCVDGWKLIFWKKFFDQNFLHPGIFYQLIQIPLYASALFFPPTNVPKPIEGIFAPDRSTSEFISVI